MSKRLYAEQLKYILDSGDPTISSNIDPRDIELAIGENADSLMLTFLLRTNNSRQNKKFFIPREFLRKRRIELTSNIGTLSGKNTPLSVPSGRTVYQVKTVTKTVGNCTIKAEDIHIVTTPTSIFSGLESSTLEGKYGCIINNSGDNNEVEIEILNTGSATVDEVDVFIVPSSFYADREDSLAFPPHLVNNLLEMTLKQMAPHLDIPKDEKQDNSDKPEL